MENHMENDLLSYDESKCNTGYLRLGTQIHGASKSAQWQWGWWHLYVFDDLWMLVTEFRYWWHPLNVGTRHQCKKIVDIGDQNSQNYHQKMNPSLTLMRRRQNTRFSCRKFPENLPRYYSRKFSSVSPNSIIIQVLWFLRSVFPCRRSFVISISRKWQNIRFCQNWIFCHYSGAGFEDSIHF